MYIYTYTYSLYNYQQLVVSGTKMIQKFNFRHARPISSPRVCLKASLNMGGGSKWSIKFMFLFLFERTGRDSQPGIFVWRVPKHISKNHSIRISKSLLPCFVEADRRNLQEAIPRSLADGPGVQKTWDKICSNMLDLPNELAKYINSWHQGTQLYTIWLLIGDFVCRSLVHYFSSKKTVCSKVKLKLLGFHNPHVACKLRNVVWHVPKGLYRKVKKYIMLRDFLMSILDEAILGLCAVHSPKKLMFLHFYVHYVHSSVLCTAIFDSVLRMCFRCVMLNTTLWRTDSTVSICYYEPSNNTNLSDLKGNMFWSWYLWFGPHFFQIMFNQTSTSNTIEVILLYVWRGFVVLFIFSAQQESPKMGNPRRSISPAWNCWTRIAPFATSHV